MLIELSQVQSKTVKEAIVEMKCNADIMTVINDYVSKHNISADEVIKEAAIHIIGMAEDFTEYILGDIAESWKRDA